MPIKELGEIQVLVMDIPEWLGNALLAASKRRNQKTEMTPPNYETGFLLRWLEDETVLRRVRNLMIETPGHGADGQEGEQNRFNYAVILELRAAEEKGGDSYLNAAVYKAFSHRIQWHKLYAQTVAKLGSLIADED